MLDIESAIQRVAAIPLLTVEEVTLLALRVQAETLEWAADRVKSAATCATHRASAQDLRRRSVITRAALAKLEGGHA